MESNIAQRLSLWIGMLFVIFLLGLAGKELLMVRSATAFAQQDAKLERNWEFDSHLRRLGTLLRDAELGVHAYVISGNRAYLPKPEILKDSYDNEVRRLHSLAGDGEEQQEAARFETFASRQLQQLEAEIAAPQAKGNAAAAMPPPLDKNWENLKRLRELEAAIGAEQSSLIQSREATVRQRYRYWLAFGIAACTAFMLLLTFFYKMNRRHSALLDRSRDALKSKNDDLENGIALRAEQLAALSHHLLAVSEQEKVGLARELHDELGSNLTAIRLELLAAAELVEQKNSPLAARMEKALQVLRRTHDIKRRIIENLRPGTLEHFGLATAIRDHCDEVARRSGLQIDVRIDEELAGIDAARAIAMYRIVQESLTNTVKYAQAKQVSVSLTQDRTGLRLHIADDGVGFAKNVLKTPKSHGIVGMRERATLLGGRFEIHGGAAGRGTHIEVFIPSLGA